jgi:hypothetical protein
MSCCLFWLQTHTSTLGHFPRSWVWAAVQACHQQWHAASIACTHGGPSIIDNGTVNAIDAEGSDPEPGHPFLSIAVF